MKIHYHAPNSYTLGVVPATEQVIRRLHDPLCDACLEFGQLCDDGEVPVSVPGILAEVEGTVTLGPDDLMPSVVVSDWHPALLDNAFTNEKFDRILTENTGEKGMVVCLTPSGPRTFVLEGVDMASEEEGTVLRFMCESDFIPGAEDDALYYVGECVTDMKFVRKADAEVLFTAFEKMTGTVLDRDNASSAFNAMFRSDAPLTEAFIRLVRSKLTGTLTPLPAGDVRPSKVFELSKNRTNIIMYEHADEDMTEEELAADVSPVIDCDDETAIYFFFNNVSEEEFIRGTAVLPKIFTMLDTKDGVVYRMTNTVTESTADFLDRHNVYAPPKKPGGFPRPEIRKDLIEDIRAGFDLSSELVLGEIIQLGHVMELYTDEILATAKREPIG